MSKAESLFDNPNYCNWRAKMSIWFKNQGLGTNITESGSILRINTYTIYPNTEIHENLLKFWVFKNYLHNGKYPELKPLDNGIVLKTFGEKKPFGYKVNTRNKATCPERMATAYAFVITEIQTRINMPTSDLIEKFFEQYKIFHSIFSLK